MVKPPAIFLRVGCILPNGLRLKQKPFDKAWMSVENAAPAQLDLAVREVGWHFMWIESVCSRLGCGGTDQAAITRAITRSLTQTPTKFNAAELGSVRVSRYFGLHIAKATLHSRHIQQSASLSSTDEMTIRELAPE
ncbi:MAG: hypothetical protein WBD46_05140 [Acidobacteriaceae bacterium]